MKEPMQGSAMASTYPLATYQAYCSVAHPMEGYRCTRPAGHAGDHVAHDGDAWDAGFCDILAIWSRRDERES